MTEHNPNTEDRLTELEQAITNRLERRKVGIMERHAQTIIVFVILAVLSWVGYSILETGRDINVTNTSIAVMQTDMAHMKETLDTAASQYISKVEYTITKNEITKDILEIKTRLLQLEKEFAGNGHNHKK